MISNSRPARPVRSYISREGRLTRGQRQAIETLFPVYGLDTSGSEFEKIDFSREFGREADTVLEIGFGDGEALLQMARENPQNDYLGIEVHRPGLGHLLLQVKSLALENVRVAREDAVEFIPNAVMDSSLDRICLFFPDPWPKKKHHKRRILQQPFIALCTAKLKPGGLFHFATDWQDYAQQALLRFDDVPGLVNLAGAGCYSPRPQQRPLTKFEKRGIRLGHGVWDIIMQKPRQDQAEK
jgi:tRNA (guanine-N7-)-methyltransferase